MTMRISIYNMPYPVRKMTAAFQPIDSHRSPNLRPLEIRRDLRAVADLVELCFAETLDADGRRYIHQIRAAAENPRTLGLVNRVSSSLSGYVWEEDGRIVGNLNLLPVVAVKRQSYLIANVAVHPDCRRRGIARSLTQAAIEFIRKRGISSAWLQVNEKNPGAEQLYSNFGFVERSRRTVWHSTQEAANTKLSTDISISTRKARDWKLQSQWLDHFYPEEVRWHLVLKPNLLKPGLPGIFNRLFSERRFRQWSAHQGRHLIGTVSWQSSYTQADWLWLATTPQHQDLAISSLLPYAKRFLAHRRTLAVNFPAGVAVQALEASGFKSHQTLIWMHTYLH